MYLDLASDDLSETNPPILAVKQRALRNKPRDKEHQHLPQPSMAQGFRSH